MYESSSSHCRAHRPARGGKGARPRWPQLSETGSHMHFRALPLLIILLGTAAAQTTTMQHSQLPLSATDANATTFGSVTGTVTTLDDRTLRDAHVELRNIMTGAMLTSTTAAPDGSFQIYNIPPGTYEVSASSGTHEAREQIEIRSTPVSVRLQLALSLMSFQPAPSPSLRSMSRIKLATSTPKRKRPTARTSCRRRANTSSGRLQRPRGLPKRSPCAASLN